MTGAIYSAASGLNYNSQVVDTAANNLANAVTSGYQSRSLQASAQAGGGVAASGVRYDFSGGPLLQTGQASSLAISGQGYFQVETSGGDTSYTRSGDFVQDAQGYLRTPDGGYLVSGGSRVQAPAGSSLSVGSGGAITATLSDGSTQNLGTLQLANFSNSQGLTPTGGGLYSPSAASGQASTGSPGTGGMGTVVSGALEISNVDPATEMVSMIVGQRGFEANVKTIQVSDEMLRKAYEMVDTKKHHGDA
ncbi:MAG: flagellar hook basal-body protein [Verrucomicrobium sp.]|nr:flagellar hook basal-body protein [Verrucomicrobium sp.]